MRFKECKMKDMTNNYDIFISYSRADLERVKAIKAELERSTGALCWMDLDGIESGEQFEDVIISAINRSGTMLFMLSERSMRSEWALDELDFAKKKKKRIVIVHLEEVELSNKFYFRYHKYDQIMWHNMPQREKLFRDIKRWTANDGSDKTIQDSYSLQNTLYDVILVKAGAAKLQVVKAVKETCGMGLKEAKDLVDGAPSILRRNIPLVQAGILKEQISSAGATVEIMSSGQPKSMTKENSEDFYDVVLVNAGAAKLQAVKAVKETCGLGLKEAKDLVDGAPLIISGGLSYADAKMQKQTIEASGAQVKIVKKSFNH